MTPAAVAVSNLVKTYHDKRSTVTVLDGLSFEVGRGEIVAVLGPNGAGKTTLVSILSTLLQFDSGTVEVCGFDVRTSGDEVRGSISLTGQHAAVDRELTGEENLLMFARLLGRARREARRVAQGMLERFDLTSAADRLAKDYSGGMRRRLDLAIAMIDPPGVLLLDEPTTGLDVRSRLSLWQTVEEIRAAGTAVVLTTQYLEEADALADRIVLIAGGRVRAEGTADDLKRTVGSGRGFCTPADEADLGRLLEVARTFTPRCETADGSVVVYGPNSDQDLIELVVRARGAGIGLESVELRGPTLDDAFLALTGDRPDAEPVTEGSAR